MDLGHCEKAVSNKGVVPTSFKVKEHDLKTQVQLITKAIDGLLKVVVPGLQCWGSVVTNISGVISTPTLEVVQENHSMQKLTYLGPVKTNYLNYKTISSTSLCHPLDIENNASGSFWPKGDW